MGENMANAPPQEGGGGNHGDAASNSKMKRKLACNQCRAKKAKCDGNTPCSGCKNARINCVYSAPRKRGVPSGYLQKLERENEHLRCLLGLVIEGTLDGPSYLKDLDQSLTDYSPQRRAELKSRVSDVLNGTSPLTASTAAAHNSFTFDYPNSSTSHHAHSYSDFSTDESIPPATYQAASMGGGDFATTTSYNADDNQLKNLGLTSGFDKKFVASFQRLQLSRGINFDVHTWANLIQPCRIIELLEIYFTYGNSMYPMLDKTEIVRLAYSPERFKMSSKSCLLWSVILVGYNLTSVKDTSTDTLRARAMYDLAFCTLDSIHSLESVQALLVQSMFFLGKGFWGNSWLFVGNAVRMALDLGISNHEDVNLLSFYERRTWKCCCVVDSIISARIGRIPQVQAHHGHFFEELEEAGDSMEEWELWKPFNESNINNLPPTKPWISEPARAISIFNAFYKLNEISNRFITVVNKPYKSNEWSEETKNQFLAEISASLKAWENSCPPHIKLMLDEDDENLQLLPHNGNLILTYVSLCSMIYAAVGDDERYATYGLPTCEQLIQLTQRTTEIYISYFHLNKVPPTFEHFHSVLITVLVRNIASQQQKDGTGRKIDEGIFKKFLGHLEKSSDTWGGSLITVSYLRDIQNKIDCEEFDNQYAPKTLEFDRGFSSFLNDIYNDFFNSDEGFVMP